MPDNDAAQLHAIPYLPGKVDVCDLKPNGKLYSDDEISEIKKAIDQDGRHHNKKSYPYDIIKNGSEYFAIYKGNSKDQNKGLGQGGFGKVKLVQNLVDGTWCALKILLEEKHARHDQEISMLTDAGMLILKSERRKQKLNYTRYELLMTLAPGKDIISTLQDLKKNKQTISPVKLLDIIMNCIDEVADFRNKGLIHRDIKPQNMILDYITGRVKLIDFGLSVREDEHGSKIHYSEERVGTPGFAAPEIYYGYLFYNEKTEIYALGLSLALLCGFDCSIEEVTYSVESLRKANLEAHEFQIRTILMKMLDIDVSKRPTLNEVKSQFAKIRENEVQINPVKVKFFDLLYYSKSTDAQKKVLIEDLKTNKFDHVCLTHPKTQTFSDHDYMNIHQFLESAGIVVASEVLIYEPTKEKEAIEKYKKNQLSKYGNVVIDTSEDFSAIISALDNEYKRLSTRCKNESGSSKKVLEERMGKVKVLMDGLSSPMNSYTIDQVILKLKQLALEMSKTNALTFYKPSQGTTNINEIIKDHTPKR